MKFIYGLYRASRTPGKAAAGAASSRRFKKQRHSENWERVKIGVIYTRQYNPQGHTLFFLSLRLKCETSGRQQWGTRERGEFPGSVTVNRGSNSFHWFSRDFYWKVGFFTANLIDQVLQMTFVLISRLSGTWVWVAVIKNDHIFIEQLSVHLNNINWKYKVFRV